MSAVANPRIRALFRDLTPPQAQAVRHVDGPLLVLAGAGSGKTRVITRRAGHLACVAGASCEILAITFTNKAAQELRDRIAALGVGRGITARTFHAFCARTLRRYADRAGVSANYTILDREDRRKVIKETIESCELSTTNWSPARIDAMIGRAKNALQGPDEFETAHEGWQGRTIARIYRAYEARLELCEALDFDDLLLRMARLLARDEALRDALEDEYRYVLIDEYQDTNAAQYEIARLLTRTHHNLCATGDPDQSIYGWRGADIRNILSFERDYPDARVVRLEQNYRSTRRILSASSALIAENVNRKTKSLWTENDEGARVRVVECDSGDEEASWIATDVTADLKRGASPRDVAVFYRMNAQSRALEEAFLRRGIAYQIARGLAFYARKEIKDVLAYLNVAINPADEVSLSRVINTPTRGIGATSIARLKRLADRSDARLFDVITGGGEALEAIGRSASRVRAFGALLTSLRGLLDRPPHEVIEKTVSLTGLRAMYAAEATPDRDPIANIDELINGAGEFERLQPGATLLDWLEHTSLLSDVDGVRDERGMVTLMTLHAAKGLEFPHVYIVGLEDGVLPLRRFGASSDDDTDIEEERRLCFVGMTRAKERLTLSHARYRMLRGVTERRVRSAFLDELPADEIEWKGSAPRRSGRRRTPDRGRLPDDIDEWSVGTLVRHESCGLGRVTALSRGSARTHVQVEFEDGTSRAWVLEFADLERVDVYDVG